MAGFKSKTTQKASSVEPSNSSNEDKNMIYTCLNCSTELKKDKVYTSRNSLLDKPFTLCKACACRVANEDIKGCHQVLMLLDIPFLPDLYEVCQAEENMFSAYMLRVNNPRKKYEDDRNLMDLHYCDSPNLNRVEKVDEYLYKSDAAYAVLQDLFGSWWKREQLVAMDKELDRMFIDYGGDRDNTPMRDLYCELITLKWLARDKFSTGAIKEGQALSDTRQKLLKDNGMNVQAIRDKKTNDSIGEKIDWSENEPILPSKKYYDVDGIMFMWDKLITQLLRFIGANKTSVDVDAKEMIDYVDDHPEYCQDRE